MSTYTSNPYYANKVSLWCRLLHGVFMLNKESIKLVGRLGLSFFMLFLVYTGQAPATFGITGATITSGIDVAAFIEALKIVQSGDGMEDTNS